MTNVGYYGMPYRRKGVHVLVGGGGGASPELSLSPRNIFFGLLLNMN